MSDDRYFFEQHGEWYHPTPAAAGPWDPGSLHGRVLSGLIAHQVEADFDDPAFQPARLTTDMFRVAPRKPVRVATTLVRDGNRIRVVDASIVAEDGTQIARGNVVYLRATEQPAGEVWSMPDWDVPHPETLPLRAPSPNRPADWVPTWESRSIEGDMGTVVQKRIWLRETHGFVAGVENSPFVRAAQAADFANPWANSGSAGLNFVNADLTMYLHRNVEGDWIGLEVAGHHSSRGIAIGECVMYDLQGAIGRVSVCSISNRRRQ